MQVFQEDQEPIPFILNHADGHAFCNGALRRETFIWRDNIFLHYADGAGKVNKRIGMSMLSPSLPCQLTSQVSEEYKAAAAPLACVQAFRLRAILMIVELYKDYCLKYNPLSSLTKALWLTLSGLTQQPHVGTAAYSHAGSLQTMRDCSQVAILLSSHGLMALQ